MDTNLIFFFDSPLYLFSKQKVVFLLTRFPIAMSSMGHSTSWRAEKAEPEPPTPLRGEVAPRFEWEKRWLKGHEYCHLLKNIDAYCEAYTWQKYEHKTHPKQIYSEPTNGMIYFVKGKGVGQDFGFPRMDQVKKKYRWKKMNFTTDLPKKHPFVTYVVASAMRAHLVEESQNAEFRMHAVIRYCQGRNASESNEYILCHVRAVDHKKELQECTLRTCSQENFVDFYRLFACLHNIHMEAEQ